jgi:hypothetical protein
MQYESYSLDVAGLTEAFNNVKDSLLDTMQRDGIIADAEALGGKYIVVVHKKGWFGQAYDKLFGKDDDKPDKLKFSILRTKS